MYLNIIYDGVPDLQAGAEPRYGRLHEAVLEHERQELQQREVIVALAPLQVERDKIFEEVCQFV